MTIITNAEFCNLVSADPVACEGVVTGTGAARVVPEAFAAVFDDGDNEAGTGAATTGPGALGDTLSRDDLELTLLKAAWKPDISDSFYQPGKGQKYVSFLVRYKALEDGADYNITFWDALDKAGTRYEAQVLGQITPDLKVGELAKGEKVQGWVTYEVPNDVNQLQLIESQVLKDDLTWSVKR